VSVCVLASWKVRAVRHLVGTRSLEYLVPIARLSGFLVFIAIEPVLSQLVCWSICAASLSGNRRTFKKKNTYVFGVQASTVNMSEPHLNNADRCVLDNGYRIIAFRHLFATHTSTINNVY
jgi:hypothetical protein